MKDNVIRNASWFGVKSVQREADALKPRPNIVKNRNRYLFFSTLILILGFVAILSRGLNLGVDFQSRTRLDLYVGSKFETSEITTIIQKEIPSVGMKPIVKYGENGTSATTTFSKPISAYQLNAVESKLKVKYGDQVSKRIQVDPVIAQEMVKKAGLAILIASVGIVLYTSIRFHYLYGIACVIALIHDILIPVALFSYSG